MRVVRWFVAMGVVGLLALSTTPAVAQAPSVALKVTPGAVKLSPGDETTVLVSLASPLTAPLQDVRLTFLGDPAIQVTLSTPVPDTLSPQIGYAWQVRVKPTAPFLDARTITVRLDYNSLSSSGALIPGVALATFDVQPRAIENVDKVAQLRLETAFDLVQENRPGVAYLILTNLSDVPLTVKQITIEHSPSVAVQASPNLAVGSVIPPQAAVTAPYTITAQSRVQPGKSNVLFRVEIEWTRANRAATGTLYAASKFDVAVFGESALTTIFGVPSFLVLPGLLIVVMLRWVRGWVKKPLPLDYKTPEFWILAVIFSLIAAYLYPLLATNIFHTSLNYLTSYGLGDVLVVWFVSLGFGALIGVLWHLAELAAGWLYRWLFVPAPSDTPREVLGKRRRRRGGLILPYALVQQGAYTQRCVVLDQDRLTKAYWVAPLARYTWRTYPGDELLAEFDRALERAESAGKLLELIERAGAQLEIGWEQTARLIKNPTPVPEASVRLDEDLKIRLLAENKKGSPNALPSKDDRVP